MLCHEIYQIQTEWTATKLSETSKLTLKSLEKSINNSANTKEGWRRLKRLDYIVSFDPTVFQSTFSLFVKVDIEGILFCCTRCDLMSLLALSSIVYWQHLYLAMKMSWQAVTQSLEVTYTYELPCISQGRWVPGDVWHVWLLLLLTQPNPR